MEYSVDTLIITKKITTTTTVNMMMVTFDSYGCDNVCKFKKKKLYEKGATNNIQHKKNVNYTMSTEKVSMWTTDRPTGRTVIL